MIVVLSWTLAGRTYRVATRACAPVASSGPIQIPGGLPTTDVDESIEIGSSDVASTWATDVIPPLSLSAVIDVHAQVPEGEAAEVAVWAPGESWESREVAISGRVSSLTWGPARRRCRIEIDSDPVASGAEYPGADQAISDDTWDAADSAADDHPYPTIVGFPGVYTKNGDVVNYSGSPAYIVDTAAQNIYLLIADHLTDRRAITGWRIRDHTQGVEDNFTDPGGVLDPSGYGGTDGLGRRCTVLQITNAVPNRAAAVFLAWVPGDQMYVQWTGSGGQPYRDRTLEAAGDVLTWGLEKTGLAVDWARTGAARSVLPWPLAGYWDARIPVWSWIRDQLQPILPMSIRVGRDGLYPVVFPWWADASWAVDHLRQGQDITLSPEIRRVESGYSSVEVAYARNAATGESMETVRIQADRPTGRGYGVSLDARTRRLWTPGDILTVSADLCWSATTAGNIARSIAAQVLGQRIAYTVSGSTTRLRRLALGDVILLTLTDPAISRRRAIVRTRRQTGSRTVLGVETW